ncbi:cyclic AMP-dependent transcription factor ATF-3 [Patella vulgata]|uniref:cyclic AMP-dependent transcription factor ATF-3 n=1 Tax=Patella vulgata TaxID=6465 RepID=UPI0021801777|nr:cyclic AMP-dependent transcription factor ATF-3 [Patella vulgata]
MKDTIAQRLLHSIMAGKDISQSEVPSTSADNIDFLTYDDDNSNVFYSEDVGPMWTDNIIELSSSNTSTNDSQVSNVLPFEERQTEDPMLDLVKGELKHRIRSRRHASGQEDIVVDFAAEAKEEMLTGEEEERRQLRREKNRVAAQKCRGKKRERADNLEGAVARLENKQSRISAEIAKLQNEKEHLEDLISVHQTVCPKMKKHGDS